MSNQEQKLITLNIELQMNSVLFNAGIIPFDLFQKVKAKIVLMIDSLSRELDTEL